VSGAADSRSPSGSKPNDSSPGALHTHGSRRWGVIMAGGDGKRLLPLTRALTGDDRPKQFCPLIGGETLMHQTRCRVSQVIPKTKRSWF
jgi:Nucleotidyl transferase